jgi:CxxC-x17-CxxC domain-containing protein
MTRTDVVCTKCHKATSVPFTPTPGRPVFCRECFAKSQNTRTLRETGDAPRPAPVPGARKRMMAQGRKGHFMYDSKEALFEREGGMDDKDVRAFLEGLFARGARGSTEAAQEFLEEKLAAELITSQQRHALGNLVERYSFYR